MTDQKRWGYASGGTPEGYVCSKCGVSGVKLWRDGNSFDINLECVECSCAEAGVDTGAVDRDGKRTGSFGGRTDQIGIKVPAVPSDGAEGELSFWFYCAVPADGVKWWRALPTIGDEKINTTKERR